LPQAEFEGYDRWALVNGLRRLNSSAIPQLREMITVD
jgi:hypothetical protein